MTVHPKYRLATAQPGVAAQTGGAALHRETWPCRIPTNSLLRPPMALGACLDKAYALCRHARTTAQTNRIVTSFSTAVWWPFLFLIGIAMLPQVHAVRTEQVLNNTSDYMTYNRLATTVGAQLAAVRNTQEVRQRRRSKATLSQSPLEAYFDQVQEGPGVWKWRHYFDLYDKHFKRFRGTSVRFAEVGIYSGGSLKMWRSYFGPAATIIGLDIAPEVKIYEKNPTYGSPDQIFVGDQANASFWEAFKSVVAPIDIFVDDGGHAPHQQQATLLAILPHMRPGAVYWCEDVTGMHHDFAYTIFQMLVFSKSGLNKYSFKPYKKKRSGVQHSETPSNSIQDHIAGVSFYPYVIVVELRDDAMMSMISEKRGTKWQPPSFWALTHAALE